MPGSSWGIPVAHSVPCLAHIRQNPDIHWAPVQELGGVSESGNTTVSKTYSFSEVLGRRHQAPGCST